MKFLYKKIKKIFNDDLVVAKNNVGDGLGTKYFSTKNCCSNNKIFCYGFVTRIRHEYI